MCAAAHYLPRIAALILAAGLALETRFATEVPLGALAIVRATPERADKRGPGPAVTVLRGAMLVDGTGAPSRGPVTIVIAGDRIVSVAAIPSAPALDAARLRSYASSDPSIPANAAVIDLSGRWVMPGLVDVHAHIPSAFQPEVLKTLLAFGITSARSPASVAATGVAVRQRLESGELLGPRFRIAGELIDGPRSTFAPPFKVSTIDELRQTIQSQAARGFDAVKLYSNMPADFVAAGVEEAHRLGLPVIGHLGRTRWHEAAEAGIDHLAHSAYWGMMVSLLPDAVYGTSPPLREMFAPNRLFAPRFTDQWLASVDLAGPELERLATAMVRNNVSWDPNLVLSQAVIFGDEASALEMLEPRFAPASWEAEWRGGPHPSSLFWSADAKSEARQAWQVVLDAVRLLQQRGVTLTAGSDLNNPWMTPGVSLHRELQLLVEAGIPAPEVIRIATRNGAEAIGVLHEAGTIEKGKRADLLVLGADPLADIRNTRAIERIYLGGREHRPAALLSGTAQ
jgi:imidazolonepropionase-like amidohydrolase